jgi:hypothetical protein
MPIITMPIFFKAVVTPRKGRFDRPTFLTDQIPLRIPDYSNRDVNHVGCLVKKHSHIYDKEWRTNYVTIDGRLYRELSGDGDDDDQSVPWQDGRLAFDGPVTLDVLQDFLENKEQGRNRFTGYMGIPNCPVIQWSVIDILRYRAIHLGCRGAADWKEVVSTERDSVIATVHRNADRLAVVDGKVFIATDGPMIVLKRSLTGEYPGYFETTCLLDRATSVQYGGHTPIMRIDCPREVQDQIIEVARERCRSLGLPMEEGPPVCEHPIRFDGQLPGHFHQAPVRHEVAHLARWGREFLPYDQDRNLTETLIELSTLAEHDDFAIAPSKSVLGVMSEQMEAIQTDLMFITGAHVDYYGRSNIKTHNRAVIIQNRIQDTIAHIDLSLDHTPESLDETTPIFRTSV